MGRLERPAVRWAIAFLFLSVELLLFVVVLDPRDGSHYNITRADQLVMVVVSLIVFATIPSTLKTLAQEDEPFEYAADQIESTQRRRAALVTSMIDKFARMIRIETTGPLSSWIAAGVLAVLAGGTVTESVSVVPFQLVLSTVVYLLLAAFAAPRPEPSSAEVQTAVLTVDCCRHSYYWSVDNRSNAGTANRRASSHSCTCDFIRVIDNPRVVS